MISRKPALRCPLGESRAFLVIHPESTPPTHFLIPVSGSVAALRHASAEAADTSSILTKFRYAVEAGFAARKGNAGKAEVIIRQAPAELEAELRTFVREIAPESPQR